MPIRRQKRALLQDYDMTSFDEADLTQAAHMYAVANTPLFLLRKLRQDPVVYEIGTSFSGDQILDELHRAVETEPRNPVEYVRPYVYLVALSTLSEDRYLKGAAHLRNSERWDWFEYLRRVMLETYTPTAKQAVRAGGSLITSCSRLTRSNAPVERNVITLS
jgi:hypothetical protein